MTESTWKTGIQPILVGGAVRDSLLGLPVHDTDFTIVDPLGFDHMVSDLVAEGFVVHSLTPDKFTARCRVPDHLLDAIGHRDADFVLARRDGPYSDGRRPDWVEPGTLEDDLARRDFTCNAMAKLPDGTIVDLFDGVRDTNTRTLRFVGDPEQRIREDALRVLRALRFTITKGFTMTPSTWGAVTADFSCDMLAHIPTERMHVELFKMFVHDSAASMKLLVAAGRIMEVVCERDLWFKPTMEARKPSH